MVLTINGKSVTVNAGPDSDLLTVLREELDLTGTKYGCGEAACGACMVLIDGSATPSCVTRINSLEGKKIETIEGLEKNDKLHKVQEAFLKTDPFQCSYCASGMIIATVSLLSRNPKPTDAQIVDVMNRNICRCGTYANIIKAIKLAASS
ncbi:(2Fe-2S)-binding protein [Daejeonella lutea]|uniref:Isoquinoline 1-oxidoreductase, alpha subunit n=1 Tax=Daejeonella lutea TaxID=572036 RepID=A0A1T5BC12_9SPHI|nr:(2Fe-2S)-binding protein [Daejeonella lutea]SKB44768.1 isoquinoline 1-oxidoreductase, alpha subunit [Daejeonella lutea]